MPTPRGFVVEPALADFLKGPVATIVASRDAHNRPRVARGYCGRVTKDGARVSVHVPTVYAGGIKDDIRDNGRVAVVFSRVSDFRTYQLKGTDAEIGPELPMQTPDIARYCDDFLAELVKVRMPPECTAGFRFDRYTRLSFTPSACFLQTPGPNAGVPLRQDDGRNDE